MPLQFATIEEPSFGRGIDARSSENQIRDGFVRDLVNSDIIEGRVTKRKGYTNYSGNVPVRVVKYRQAANPINKVYFTLDGSIDLSRVETTPILVYGTTGVTPSALQTVRYFPNWATNLKKVLLQTTATFTSGTGTSSATLNVVSTTGFGTTGRFLYGATSYIYTGITPTSFTGVSPVITYSNGETVTEQEIVSAPFTEHSISSTDIYVGMGLLTSNDLSNECVFPDVTIDGTTYDISATYTNGGPSKEVVLFYVDGRDILGEKYATTKSGTTFTIPATGVGGHNLASTNILSQVYKDIGSGTLERVYPDQVQLNKATGDITFTFTENNTYRVLLSTAPSNQSFDGVPVANNGDFRVTLANVTSPYMLYSVYTNAGEEIHPDTVSYDDINKTATFVFSTYNQAISLYYIHGTVRTNEISVDTSVSASLETDSPQLTIYGLPHSNTYDAATDTTEYGIYGDAKEINRRGWVTHLDSYKSPNTTHMVAGLGGNLFAALSPFDTYFPAGFSPAFPTYYPNLNSRTAASDRVIGPAFWSPNETPNRTRATLHFTGGSTHWATVTAVQHISGNTVRYTFSVPGAGIQNGSTLNDVFSTSDKLTIKGMSSSRHNGTFAITAWSPLVSDSFTVDVTNPRIKNSDYDDNGCAGLGGIFTDQVVLSGSNPFIVGDEFLSSAWGSTTQLLVDSVSNLTVTLSQVYDKLSLTASLVVTGKRTSNQLPLRNKTVGLAIGDLYLVKGDTLNIDYINRPLQVTAVDTVNNVVTLDEVLTWEDNISLPTPVNVSKRWIPAESPTPDNSDVLLPQTTTRYLTANPYDNQPFLRSAMVQNNLYLTNGNDEVYKYDGRNFYRAGIIPWQPGLFLTVENTPSGGIPLVPVIADDGGGGDVLELIGGRIKIDRAQAERFDNGDTVVIIDGTTSPVSKYYLTLKDRELESSGNHYFFSFVEPLPFTTLGSGATVQMILVYTARYYFRLNIKDANGVTTSSAVTGAEDFIIQISPETANQQKVHIRLIGLPAWDQYDFSNQNIQLEVYRTLWYRTALGEVPTFYRFPQTKACTFAGADGYLDLVDTYSNASLTQEDDLVGVLSPTPLPADWEEPPRAKYVTTAGNRLVLANVTDWPTLAISYFSEKEVTQVDFNNQKFTFLRDESASILTNSDMLNQVSYQLTTNAGVAATIGSTTGGFTISVTPATAPVAGDWVYLYFTTADAHPLDFCGWWQINSVSGAGPYICTIKSTKPYIAPTHPIKAVFATTSKDVPVFIDNTFTNRDYNMGMASGPVAGFQVPSLRIIRRLGEAINATMRMVDTSLQVYSKFQPWIVARSESDTVGQLLVKQPRVEATLLGMTITTLANVKTYVNGNLISSGGTKVKSLTTRYPSRILASYNNFPEIFDNPWAVNDDASDSAVDINSADGQEITGVIPFFGDSAFGASQQAGVLVVFKQNSIYLVNLAAKAEGINPVQRLETQGLGCTAPYSIAPTKDGIAFANDSGVYVLRRNQRIEYLGRYVERLWQKSVDKNWLSLVQGHHYGVGRQYKLSVPLSTESTSAYAANSEVYVYNHTGESDGEAGGWARYTNHPATGWANLFQDAFFSTTGGAVKSIRNTGEASDYRDDANAIESVLEARATAFGNTAVRKAVATVTVHYRSGANSNNTSVYMAPDLYQEYDLSSSFRILSQPSLVDGLGTVAGQDVVSIAHSFPKRRCIYMSIKITNTGKDENVEIAGFSYTVAGLSGAGIKQAGETE